MRRQNLRRMCATGKPVEWSLGGAGYNALRDALGGTLKLDAKQRSASKLAHGKKKSGSRVVWCKYPFMKHLIDYMCERRSGVCI